MIAKTLRLTQRSCPSHRRSLLYVAILRETMATYGIECQPARVRTITDRPPGLLPSISDLHGDRTSYLLRSIR